MGFSVDCIQYKCGYDNSYNLRYVHLVLCLRPKTPSWQTPHLFKALLKSHLLNKTILFNIITTIEILISLSCFTSFSLTYNIVHNLLTFIFIIYHLSPSARSLYFV